jgi:hypothetical protein
VSHNPRTEKREQVIRRVLSVLSAERWVNIEFNGVAHLAHAEAELELACREVVRAIDALPPGTQPKGWALTPGAAAPPAAAEPYPARTFRATPTSVQGPGMTEPVAYLPEGETRCGWSEGCVNGPAVHLSHVTCQEHPEVTG